MLIPTGLRRFYRGLQALCDGFLKLYDDAPLSERLTVAAAALALGAAALGLINTVIDLISKFFGS